MCFFPKKWGGREIPLHKIPKQIPKQKKMQSYKITATTEITENSNLKINEFLDNIKESFEKVIIISIESLPMDYSKFNNYNYKVKFYHDLYLKF